MLKNKLKSNAKKIDLFIKSYINSQKKSMLTTPMNYGVLSGGKKIRSSVIIATGKLYKIKPSKLFYICGAVECIYSYSLIHDDLPCMDNDKLRRGKPTAHIKFGEATAVLAGNSLLTLAFEMISDKKFNINSLLFQLADDFLDIKGKSKYTGKTVHKDKKKGKSTVINLAGYDYAYNYAIKLKKKILRNLEKHGKNANDLRDIVNFTLERKY